MKTLIAILTCHRYHDRADAIRQTWLQDVPDGVDVRFFLGRPHDYAPGEREILLDVPDEYTSLPAKSRAIYRCALEHGYDFVFKCDDDTYLQPGRLLASNFMEHDYSGRLRGPSGDFPAPYASGFAYWTSARAFRILAEADLGTHTAEDRWVGNVLSENGIHCHLDDRYVVTSSRRNTPNFIEGPRQGNQIIAACEYGPSAMRQVHQQWKSGQQSAAPRPSVPVGAFDRVQVLIRTLLRDGMLFNTLAAVEKHLPGMKMIVIDDGRETRAKIQKYSELRRRGHACLWLPFDSGFGAKTNEGMKEMNRPYTLIGSDDFNFAEPEVPVGILKMISILDHRYDVASVAGRVNNNPYEGFIEYCLPDYIREHALDVNTCTYEETPDGVSYVLVDHTVNYNLVRAELLGPGKIMWGTKHKIGGDHFGFYHQLRQLGHKIAWAPGVNINEQKHDRRLVHPSYGNYRARARLAVPDFLREYGIQKFIGFDGREDRL